MNYFIKLFLLFVLTGIFIQTGCTKKETDLTQAIGFSMSDTMMSKCSFHTVEEKEVFMQLRLYGKITPDNNKQAQVYPIVGGNVIKINVSLGDYVKQGQVLATVRSSEVAEFDRELLSAKSDVAVAEKNLKVSKEMFEGKLNSEKDVISAEQELEKARAELKRIQEVFSIYNLGTGSIYNITAPISGFILYKNISPNEQLRNDKSDALFSIAQIDDVWVLANVNESDIKKVSLGYDAEVQTIAYSDRIFYGKVDKIFNALDADTKSMKVMIRISNPDLLLKPEMNATITLNFSENKKLVAVPSTSVIFDKNKDWVMVFRSRTDIETRRVEVYRQLGDITWLSYGLEAGEQVISENGLYIYDALND